MLSLFDLCRKNIVTRVMKGDWDLYDHLREKLPQSLWDAIEEDCCVKIEKFSSMYNIKHAERKYIYRDKVHRESDKPSIIRENFSGGKLTVTCYTWCRNGIQSRDNSLPTQLTTGRNGNIISLFWHPPPKDGHPTQLSLQSSSFTMWWKKHGMYHRNNNLPAIIRFGRKNIDGHDVFYLRSIRWCMNGERCRTGGLPTEITYRRSGQVIMSIVPEGSHDLSGSDHAEKMHKEYSDEYQKYLHYFL
jgi:hypothetical protein